MTKTYRITRADLKKRAYKKLELVEKTGTVPEKREVDLLAQVLKKAMQK